MIRISSSSSSFYLANDRAFFVYFYVYVCVCDFSSSVLFYLFVRFRWFAFFLDFRFRSMRAFLSSIYFFLLMLLFCASMFVVWGGSSMKRTHLIYLDKNCLCLLCEILLKRRRRRRRTSIKTVFCRTHTKQMKNGKLFHSERTSAANKMKQSD